MEEADRVAPTIRFGVFEVDIRSGELRRSGVRVKIQEQPFKVLASLLEHPGEVVTREELRHRIWPNESFGDFDHAVNVAVGKLRTALGDSAEIPRIIETLHRRGYRLILPITTENPATQPLTTPVTLVSAADESKRATSLAPRVGAVPAGTPVASAHGKWMPVLAIITTMAIAIGFTVRQWSSRSRVPNLQTAEITKLTDSGTAAYVSISPDGRYVVYALREGEKLGLWVRQVATRSDVQILAPEAVDFQGLSFSSDGNYIYFVRSDKNNLYYKSLYSMPVLGGPARLLIKDVDSAASFSANGRQFVFTRGTPSRNVLEVLVANADGSGEHVLASFASGGPEYTPGATWSPDGRTIAVTVMLLGEQVRWVLYTVSVANGSSRELYSSRNFIGRPAWLSGEDLLLIPLGDPFSKRPGSQLWTISNPQGEARRFTNDLSDYGLQIDLTRDGRILAATVTTALSNIWVAPAADPSTARQITFGESAMFDVAENADGKIMSQSPDGKLWIMNADGTQRAIFADNRNSFWLRPCGHYAIFASFENGQLELRRVDADGSNPTKLVSGDLSFPTCSPDGKFVYYLNNAHPEKVWRIAAAGGTPIAISDVLGEATVDHLTISPDGRFLAYLYGLVTPPAIKLAVIPTNGGPPLHIYGVPGGIFCTRWSPRGTGLQYLITRNGVTNIWEQSLTGGEPKQVTKFTSGTTFDFDWSPDNKRLLLTRGRISSDVVLFSNFR